MPSIDHVGLYVADLDVVSAFYVQYLGGQRDAGYHNPRTGLRTHFITFEGGARLEVMTHPDHHDQPSAATCGYAHVAFNLGSSEAVDALVERLKAEDAPVLSGPRTTGDGYYEAVVLDPEGNHVELVG